jgi:outer membrane lipoprotein-sorting protein
MVAWATHAGSMPRIPFTRMASPVFRAKTFPILFLLAACCALPARAATLDAAAIIKAAIDHWRGTSSESTMTMIIHRPDWQRSMTMQAWTEGDKSSLVRVLEPKKDAGNGTLLLDKTMWTFSPKINRVIKIPSSMMSQSWMGSDFSNKDIARSTDIIDQYTHRLTGSETHEGHTVWVIESVPKEGAPVVWGKEILKVRDDYVLMEHAFYDQDGKLVKRMTTLKVGVMGGRPVALQERMRKIDKPGEWTEVQVKSARFDIRIPPGTFTLSNLRNPRF